MDTKKTQHRGNCQCCAREQAVLNTGRMAKHGYTVDDGWFQGVCDGEGYAPMQVDRHRTDLIVKSILTDVRKLLEQAKRFENGDAHPNFVTRAARRPGEDNKVPWEQASDYLREAGLSLAIHNLKARARQGKHYAKMLSDMADRVHGQPLKEVTAPTAPTPIDIGEQRLSEKGKVLTCTTIVGARVHWVDERGFKSWTGSSAWRRLERIDSNSSDDRLHATKPQGRPKP